MKIRIILIAILGWTLGVQAQQLASGVRKVADVVIYNDSAYFSAFPSVVKLPNGDLYLAFRRAPNRIMMGAERNRHVDANSYLVAVRSTDGGRSWSREPQLMFAHPYGGSQDPCLLQLANGDLLCTSYLWIQVGPQLYDQYEGRFYGDDHWTFAGGFVIRSGDSGSTWQGPIDPGSPVPTETRSTMLGKLPLYNRGALYQGHDGTIQWAVACENGLASGSSVYLVQSRDNGRTWQYRSVIAQLDSIGLNETSIYETPRGDLVAFIRSLDYPTDQGYIARSSDGGATFTLQGMGFKGHPFHALRLPDNRVLLTYSYRHAPFGIRARILNAECTDFATSPEIVIRDDGGGTDLGYPWSVMIDDHHVLVAYYFNYEQSRGTRQILGSILEI
jgi:hypothetical protein